MNEEEKYPEAKRYELLPYWGCPHCGGNCWGAINPMSNDGYIYRCHGFQQGKMTYPGCGRLFVLPNEAHEESRQELIDAGFDVE